MDDRAGQACYNERYAIIAGEGEKNNIMTATRRIFRTLICAVFAACLSLPVSGSAQTPPPVGSPAPAPAASPAPDAVSAGLKKENRGEAFALPTFRDMAIASIMLGAYDINDNKVIDEYAKLMYCSLYREKFKSDFEWNNIRRELGNKIKSKREYFRTNYEMTGVIYLGRYSFETQDFPFVKNTALVNVGSLTLLGLSRRAPEVMAELCRGDEDESFFPTSYIFLMQQPLTLDRIKMPMDEAEKLLKRMDLMNNKERSLHARFRVRLMAAAGIDGRGGGKLMLRGELVSIDIFYDPEMTKHFATVALK